jgi:3-oxoacyl-[acyl-carrier protein] reductase
MDLRRNKLTIGHDGNSGDLVAFIHNGGSSLGRAIARELGHKGVRIVLHTEAQSPAVDQIRFDVEAAGSAYSELFSPADIESEADLVARACSVWERLDILVNLCMPAVETPVHKLYEYPSRLLDRGFHAAKAMGGSSRSSIINHCFLPSMYAGTDIEAHMPALKGSITGVTRLLCRRLGKDGVRVNTIQTGLLKLPETQNLASCEVLKLKPPVGRWGAAEDVSKFVSFLALRNGYMTGQAVILDGGMTAGNTGT